MEQEEQFEQEPEIRKEDLFKTIWFRPKQTLNIILAKYPEHNVILLLVLGGVVRAISRASMKDLGDESSITTILIMSFLFGGLFGWITYYLYAWGISVTGKWLGGRTEPAPFRTIIAWAMVPSVCTLLLLIPEVFVLGDELFKSEPDINMFQSISLLVFGMSELILGVWSIVILVIGIREVQSFGIGKAILNMVLPGLVVIAFLFAIGFAASLFR